MEIIIHGDADSLLAFAHTECARKFDFIRNIVFGNELPKSFDDIA